MAKKIKKNPEKHEFKEGDLVAAKVKGYPSWPGRVERVEPAKKTRYTVRFFGTHDKATSFVELKPFKSFTESEKACSKKGFQDALAECQEEYDLARRGNNKRSDNISPRKKSERGAAKKIKPEPEVEVKSKDEPEREQETEQETKDDLDNEVDLDGKTGPGEKAELELNAQPENKAELEETSQTDNDSESEEKAKLEDSAQADLGAESYEKTETELKAEVEDKTEEDGKVELEGGDELDEKIEPKREQVESHNCSIGTIDCASAPELSSIQKHQTTRLRSSTSVKLEDEKEKLDVDKNDANGKEVIIDDSGGQKPNEAENTNIDIRDNNVCLPDSDAPDDQCQLPTGSAKSDESSKDCSLNDLTSEQANADRGTQTSTDPNTIDTKKETKKELTLAKLKKKIEEKLKEKDKKKRERIEKKSFDKASKVLPKFILIFNPLAQSSLKLVDNFSNKKVAKQFITSIKNCEKYLDSLEKCLKLLSSKYGKEQKECNEFHEQIYGISKRLIQIKNSKCEAKDEALGLLTEFKRHRAIKKFINDEEIPLYHKNLIVERKENSKKRQKLVR